MLMTGLLSLNIHDSLTFDGNELCLHPDLFAGAAEAPSQQTRSTTAAHTTNKSSSSDDNANPNKRSGGATASTGSGATVATPGSMGVLSVGDMIEIRVWDPAPSAGMKSPSNTTIRPGKLRTSSSHNTPSPPLHVTSTSTLSTPPISLVSSNPSSGAPTLPLNTAAGQVKIPSNIQTTNLRPRAASLANSLAYSTESDSSSTPTKKNKSNDVSTAETSNKDESKNQETTPSGSPTLDGDKKSPVPPAKAVTLITNSHNQSPPEHTISASASAGSGSGPNASFLPPVFPRVRLNSNATDVGPGAASSRVTKPMTINRRNKTSTSTIPAQRSPKTSRHSREISDVTVESHQLDIHDIQNLDSNESDFITANDTNWQKKMSATHNLRLSFVLLVTEKTLTSLKGNARTQISMLRQVADLYSLSSYDTVTVHRIEQEDEEEVLKAVSVDYVVVSIKDQFISRGDMVYFQNSLKGSWIYEGERLTENVKNIKAHAREIRHGNYVAKSGIVTEDTMIAFRSRSARIIWLVQLSCEMWDYTSPYDHSYQPQAVCEIYFDQWIRFIYKLFTKWKELEVRSYLFWVYIHYWLEFASDFSLLNVTLR
jgi:hypothetical protein